MLIVPGKESWRKREWVGEIVYITEFISCGSWRHVNTAYLLKFFVKQTRALNIYVRKHRSPPPADVHTNGSRCVGERRIGTQTKADGDRIG